METRERESVHSSMETSVESEAASTTASPPPPLSDPSPMAARASSPPLSPTTRSATFSARENIGVPSAVLWRNKSVSCEAIRSFEATRKTQIDGSQKKDRAYWHFFEKEILRAKEENERLQRFFQLRIQADLMYAESLKKIRQVIERPPTATAVQPPGSSGPSSVGTAGVSGVGGSDPLQLMSSCAKALNTLGEVQQQLSEKIVQFTNVIKRDVVLRPLDEMITTFDERIATMLAEGNKLDASLAESQRNVVNSFAKYDAIFREMEHERNTNTRSDAKQDLWLAEIAYAINVQKLRQVRIEYVKGMSGLFQQYKTLEVLRVSVIQTALDTYIRKQKLTYDELAGSMSEPMAAVQRIDAERDVVHSVRRIPKNFTAMALSSTDNTDEKLFNSLRSPLASPLLVRCGFLKHQVSGSIFKSWKDVLCAITHDEFLHLIDLKENSNRSISQSTEALLVAICTNDASTDVTCTSICLTNCRIEILGKSAVPTFEITEMTQLTGLLSTVFRMETSRRFTFQCSSQSDLIDWVVAAKRFITTGSSMINK